MPVRFWSESRGRSGPPAAPRPGPPGRDPEQAGREPAARSCRDSRAGGGAAWEGAEGVGGRRSRGRCAARARGRSASRSDASSRRPCTNGPTSSASDFREAARPC